MATAQTTLPLGASTDVSGLTAETWSPSVAVLEGGRSAVVWTEDGNDGIWLRLFGADGTPDGGVIRVTGADGRGNRPSVALLENGNFVVTFTALVTAANAEIHAQIFTPDGTSVGPIRTLFENGDSTSVSPETIGLSGGASLTVFNNLGLDGDRFGVYAQLADASGRPSGEAFLVNQTTSSFQSAGVAAKLDDGGFVITWRSRDVDGSFYAVMQRTYDADGTPRSDEIRVNQYSSLSQSNPDITVLTDGRFVISWESDGQDGSGDGVYARFYDADGTPDGYEFRVNSTTLHDQNSSSVAATANGGFVIVWVNELTDSTTDIRLQQFDSAGSPIGVETILTEGPGGVSWAPDISIGDDGHARLVWHNTDQGTYVGTVFVATVMLNTGGTEGDDVIEGTSAADVLQGLGGDDRISANNGYDTVFGGGGADSLFGGAGGDYLYGGDGADVINGGKGHDILFGDAGADVLSGVGGDDFLFGDGAALSSMGGAADQVYRLYHATLDRDPDPAGYQGWATRIFTGEASLETVAQGFVGSAEFQSQYASLSNSGFIELLYENVLGRASDDAGKQTWLDRMANGMTEAQVVAGFSESLEFQNSTAVGAAAFAQERTQSDWADDVFRLYQATLGRDPDFDGFEAWTDLLAGGTSLETAATRFSNSQEFQNTYGSLSDAQFIEQLYENVLGRGSDAAGLQGWLDEIEDGMTRAQVVLGFSQSGEFRTTSAADLEAWTRAQGADDELAGGAGDNTLFGGMMSDTFVFEAARGGTHRVLDLESWDTLQFSGFGYGSDADVRAHLTQQGADVAFSDQGVEALFVDTQLSDITDQMLQF